MKKVLFITTHFAPDIHVGAKRMTKFARHLTDYGWQPVILPKEINEYHGVDETLLQELSANLPIYRIPEWHPFQRQPQLPTVSGRLSSPNRNWARNNGLRSHLLKMLNLFFFYDYSWLLPAFFSARRLLQQEDINLIYSSAPDNEAHMVALLLRLTKSVKWICEFRDPWTTLHPYYNFSFAKRKSDKCLERLVLNCSDHVISVGQMLKEELIKLGNLCHDKISVIYNGYDKDDFIDSAATVTKDSRCVITYAGTWGPGRSPEYFLKALNMLLQRRPEMRENLQVNFIGEFKYSPDLERKTLHYIEQANLKDVVTIIPWLPYKEALARLLTSDILLLVERPETPTNNNFWVVTSKVFLYLYARKPILALLPSGGEAARIIREADAGEIVSPTDIEAIAVKIGEMYNRFKRGDLASRVKLSDIDKYERKKQAGELAAIFDDQISIWGQKHA